MSFSSLQERVHGVVLQVLREGAVHATRAASHDFWRR